MRNYAYISESQVNEMHDQLPAGIFSKDLSVNIKNKFFELVIGKKEGELNLPRKVEKIEKFLSGKKMVTGIGERPDVSKKGNLIRGIGEFYLESMLNFICFCGIINNKRTKFVCSKNYGHSTFCTLGPAGFTPIFINQIAHHWTGSHNAGSADKGGETGPIMERFDHDYHANSEFHLNMEFLAIPIAESNGILVGKPIFMALPVTSQK